MENNMVTISAERFAELIRAEMKLDQVQMMRELTETYDYDRALAVIFASARSKETGDES